MAERDLIADVIHDGIQDYKGLTMRTAQVLSGVVVLAVMVLALSPVEHPKQKAKAI